jgi:hypothetical protein
LIFFIFFAGFTHKYIGYREYERRILQLALDLNFDVNVFRSWMHKDNGFPQEISAFEYYVKKQLLEKTIFLIRMEFRFV